MCYSNSSTSKNIDLAKKYKKEIPFQFPDSPLFYASAFSFPEWRIITQKPEIELMNWGLIPNWFKGDNYTEIASKTPNARIETLESTPSFKGLINQQRCIIPSTGYFEWQHNGKDKLPFFVFPKTQELFSMAGLYSEWIQPSTLIKMKTFTILTCEANPFLAEIHNSKKRMPLLLDDSEINRWLNEPKINIEQVKILAENQIDAHLIDKRIINSKNPNCKEVQALFKEDFIQGSLF
jgi:putative SOS response-associated peptidase YedK